MIRLGNLAEEIENHERNDAAVSALTSFPPSLPLATVLSGEVQRSQKCVPGGRHT